MKVTYQCDQCRRLTDADDPFKVRKHRENEIWRSHKGRDYCSESCLITASRALIADRLASMLRSITEAEEEFRKKPLEIGELWGASWTRISHSLEGIEVGARSLRELLRGDPRKAVVDD